MLRGARHESNAEDNKKRHGKPHHHLLSGVRAKRVRSNLAGCTDSNQELFP